MIFNAPNSINKPGRWMPIAASDYARANALHYFNREEWLVYYRQVRVAYRRYWARAFSKGQIGSSYSLSWYTITNLIEDRYEWGEGI